MKILVVGSGGREHAICWHLSRSQRLVELCCAPGNPGTASCATNIALRADDLEGLLRFARERRIDLTVVGPEAPLCAGIGDRFAEAGLRLVGPTAAAARLEGSKAFAKEFMARHGIPTASFGVFSEAATARHYIEEHPESLVIKADGLAAGKGVFMCADAEEAKAAAAALLGGSLGDAGRRILVEARLEGEEASFMVITDGERAYPLATSQDHKAVFDGDKGPNTGGMGAYSPAPVLDADRQRRIMSRIVEPTLRGMAAEGSTYRGILYVGLMISGEDISVLEYNCRLGDPEAQPILARLRSDLVPYLQGAAEGALPDEPLRWDERASLGVVMASAGYPGSHDRGHPISGLIEAESMEDVIVFQSGTVLESARLITAGGRVLCVTALGEGVKQARDRAYRAVDRISWPGAHFRRDIGYRALDRA